MKTLIVGAAGQLGRALLQNRARGRRTPWYWIAYSSILPSAEAVAQAVTLACSRTL